MLGAASTPHMLLPPQVVAPKRAALADANKRLEGANKKLSGIRARVKELQDRVAGLEESLMRATEDKNIAMAQVHARAWADKGGVAKLLWQATVAFLQQACGCRQRLPATTMPPHPGRRNALPARRRWRSA